MLNLIKLLHHISTKNMRVLTLTVLFCAFGINLMAQNVGTQEITPQVIEKLRSEIEKQIPSLKQEFEKREMNADEIEFSLDTFRIERLAAKKIELNYSTLGINVAVNDLTESYNKLMNKYYNKLFKLIQTDDKEVLIAAQKAWLTFRDKEENLIGTLTNKIYSGGGTIQYIIATGSYSEIVKKRSIKIFDYYNNLLKKP